MKKVERKNGRDGKKYPMIDVFQDDSHVDADVHTKVAPSKWIGKK